MNRDEALQKVRKCLALASSSNEHEAAAAMRQAQKLMEQFGIDGTDVSLADVSEAATDAHTADLVQWEVHLSSLVAEVFGCDFFRVQRRTLGPTLRFHRRSMFVFVGVGAAADVAAYAYEVLSRQCAKDRRAHIARQPKTCKSATKTARGDLYALAWISGVRTKVEAFAGSARSNALIAQYMERQYPGMRDVAAKDRTKGRNVKSNDWHAGAEAGRGARLDRGIAARAANAQLPAPTR
ncbi:DUF2786 domain-containing protein [Acidovorax sp. GBBC 3332]|nr:MULTISPECIES: DUF2786 domain-containing protein [unclassified Acidovorax]MDA8449800.1 DUF2786 domain-containing protein [Acidovorax sp. GBBC 3297]MDA8459245.1 DUF2786 domain-containing protein [Acidovorax sp. GBBC 3333]MDA8464282.1 DUF2786 domain-containing protein [Acidovorax sp. GBBC 3332]MDA8469508.1 DUF2786 domain-containing protein [Acidovorax sp. GBBC 3299]